MVFQDSSRLMGRDKEVGDDDLRALEAEARKNVWIGSIPLLVDLHPSEITSLPGPPALLILAPRNGYLPLLAGSIKPYFLSALPPGSDTIWFDYEGLPLKWQIPTGVLFDLLCAEPERPWRLTVHFRAYPTELLIPCEDEDAVKWNFINAMKEASYVMYGSTRSVMNMSQVDQYELWRSVKDGDLENFDHISTRLRHGSSFNSGRPPLRRATSDELETDTKSVGRSRSEVVLPGRIPMRLYIRRLKDKLDVLYGVPPVNSWDELVYITRPIDVPKDDGLVVTLRHALMKVVPHLFSSPPDVTRRTLGAEDVESVESRSRPSADETTSPESERDDLTTPGHEKSDDNAGRDVKESSQELESSYPGRGEKVRVSSSGGLWEGLNLESAIEFNGVVRIQGIEPNLDIPLEWVARNLCGPEHFIHICLCTWVAP